MAQPRNANQLRESVRVKHAAPAHSVRWEAGSNGSPPASSSSCCGSQAKSNCCGGPAWPDPITSNLRSELETAEPLSAALIASLGCGNPTALAELKAGERVLDLGSGGGFDVLLSALRVGPTGHAYGLDTTDEMLALAERNKIGAGVENVTFLKGQIEAIPLPEKSVDVVISNCAINRSTDQAQVLREAHRVLTPGGRFAVSDVVVQGEIPADLPENMDACVGCVGGVLEDRAYRELLDEAGFEDIDVRVTRVYDPRELAEGLPGGGGCCGGATLDLATYDAFGGLGGRLVSAFIRARKP